MRLDPGNYKLGRDTFAQAMTILAGREIGDTEYVAAAERTLAEREEVVEQDGAVRVRDASGLSNHYLNLARFGRENGLRDILVHGAPQAWRDGPDSAARHTPRCWWRTRSLTATPLTWCCIRGPARFGPSSTSKDSSQAGSTQ